MAIEWTDTDPDSGERRFVRAEKFARKWRFQVRFKRRTEWDRGVPATREMWETLLDALERRYRRREGVTDEDLELVRRELAGLKDPSGFDADEEINRKDTKDTKEGKPTEERDHD